MGGRGMTLDQAIKKIETALSKASGNDKVIKAVKANVEAAKRRRDLSIMSERKNVKELLFAIRYELNPPKKTERKV